MPIKNPFINRKKVIVILNAKKNPDERFFFIRVPFSY